MAEKKKPTGCVKVGPGPAYKLPTLTGYEGHDYSKYRNPAFSFGLRPPMLDKTVTPGPYKLEDVNRHGPYNKNGWSLGIRPPPLSSFNNPGPGTYAPERCPPTGPWSPKFSLGLKIQDLKKGVGPSPAEYYPKLPRSQGFSILGRHPPLAGHPTPGPGPAGNLDLIKPKAPAYQLGLRPPIKHGDCSPGPKYLPLPEKRNPCFSFGMKHNECSPPLITQDDN